MTLIFLFFLYSSVTGNEIVAAAVISTTMPLQNLWYLGRSAEADCVQKVSKQNP